MSVAMRALQISILLYGPGPSVLSVVVWELWQNGQYVELSALGGMMFLGLFDIVLLAQLASRRFGVKQAV